jgi:hypothetical protein
MKKSEIFVPLSRNRTWENVGAGFREVFCAGPGAPFGGDDLGPDARFAG